MVHAGCVFVVGIHRLGHECQDLLTLCDGMHVCTDYRPWLILSSKSFGEMESETMLTPREKSPLPKAQRRFEPVTLHHAGQRDQHNTD